MAKRKKGTTKEDFPIVLTASDIKAITGFGINQTYVLMDSGDFAVRRVGRRKIVSRDVFFSWLEGKSLEDESDSLED